MKKIIIALLIIFSIHLATPQTQPPAIAKDYILRIDDQYLEFIISQSSHFVSNIDENKDGKPDYSDAEIVKRWIADKIMNKIKILEIEEKK